MERAARPIVLFLRWLGALLFFGGVAAFIAGLALGPHTPACEQGLHAIGCTLVNAGEVAMGAPFAAIFLYVAGQLIIALIAPPFKTGFDFLRVPRIDTGRLAIKYLVFFTLPWLGFIAGPFALALAPSTLLRTLGGLIYITSIFSLLHLLTSGKYRKLFGSNESPSEVNDELYDDQHYRDGHHDYGASTPYRSIIDEEFGDLN